MSYVTSLVTLEVTSSQNVTSTMTSDVNVDKDVISGTITDIALLFLSAVCAQLLCV